jgi:error-prone DNA polymerase
MADGSRIARTPGRTRAILGASVLGCRGKVQNANSAIHLIVEQVFDLTDNLRWVSSLDAEFPLQAGRGDQAKHGGRGLDSRKPKSAVPTPRDINVPDLHINTLKMKTRNIR